MTASNASWINFLRKYGPLATNDNMYDETIEKSRVRAGVDPIVLPTPYLDEAIQCLVGAKPRSVVLCGTAGDGKTYYCRQIWERLGGSHEDWADESRSSNGMYSLRWDDRNIHIIKDLSEVKKGIVKTTLAKISKDLLDAKSSELYVIAANHGQLHEQWLGVIESTAAQRVWESIEDQLIDGKTSSSIPVRLFDLSKRPASISMEKVFDAVLGHKRWGNCESCHLHSGLSVCPILENRKRLHEGEQGALFRRRLIALMELNSQNNQHVPIRHQLMLVANILLGHSGAKNGLLSCADVEGVQREGSGWKASPYGNAVGENLTVRARRNREVFEKLDRLGLGNETSNKIDRLLTLGADDPDLRTDYDTLLGNDLVYGATVPWIRAQAAYLENGLYEDAADELSFKKQLRLQRQRLFFTVPDSRLSDYDTWHLTVYQNAPAFLALLDLINQGGQPPTEIVRRLVRGLNRIFTGELVEVSDTLILASAGSYSQARTNLLYEGEIAVRPSRGESITIVAVAPRKMALRIQLTKSDLLRPIDLPLTVLRFEFLTRVSDGALPSSFSLECYEDVLSFKSRVLASFEERRALEGEETHSGELSLRFIDLMDDGRIRSHAVEVRSL
jgi:hypothetical protein